VEVVIPVSALSQRPLVLEHSGDFSIKRVATAMTTSASHGANGVLTKTKSSGLRRARLQENSLLPSILLALTYYFAGRLGLSLAVINPSASAVWPPTGIAIAALLLGGIRLWPGVFFGALAVNLITSHNAGASLMIASGNTLEAVAAVYLLSRFARGPDSLDSVESVGRFGIFAGGIASAISATFGTLALQLTGLSHGTNLALIWITWWLGDGSGAVIVAPCVILWRRRSRRRRTGMEIIRDGAALLALIAVALTVFGGLFITSTQAYAMPFMVIPFVVWAAFRLRPHEAALAVLATSAIAVWGAMRGHGGFSAPAPGESFLLLQLFMGAVAMTSLLLSAAIAERNSKEEALRVAKSALEDKVAERTSELQTRITELRETQEALHALSTRQMRLQDEERRHVSRDLHDAVGQVLAALVMNLSIVEKHVPLLDEKGAAALAEAKANATDCVREVRTMSYLLHPPMLTEAGLSPALEWFVKGFAGRSGIEVELHIPDSLPRLPDTAEISIIRIVQEALTNVHRHSKSPRAVIELTVDDVALVLDISDEGQGMKGAREGMGIVGMRERVNELRGELRITSSAKGTVIRATVPAAVLRVPAGGQ
jgi:signal transduction histidine kinase